MDFILLFNIVFLKLFVSPHLHHIILFSLVFSLELWFLFIVVVGFFFPIHVIAGVIILAFPIDYGCSFSFLHSVIIHFISHIFLFMWECMKKEAGNQIDTRFHLIYPRFFLRLFGWIFIVFIHSRNCVTRCFGLDLLMLFIICCLY